MRTNYLKNIYKIFLIIILIFFTGNVFSQTQAKWTLMFYFMSDDKEKLREKTIEIFNELKKLELIDEVKIVALVDKGSSGGVHTFASGSISLVGWPYASGTSLNLTSGSSPGNYYLKEFIQSAKSTCPAQHYILFISGDGDAWKSSGRDMIDGTFDIGYTFPIYEGIYKSLKAIKDASGKTLDILCLDSCRQSSAETIYQIGKENLVNYLVAPEEDIAWINFIDYEGIITKLQTAIKAGQDQPKNVAKLMLSISFLAPQILPQSDITALDLVPTDEKKKVNLLKQYIDELANYIYNKRLEEGGASLGVELHKLQMKITPSLCFLSSDEADIDMIMKHLMDKFPNDSELQGYCTNIRNLVRDSDSIVIDQVKTWIKNKEFKGISIFLPTKGRDFLFPEYEKLLFSQKDPTDPGKKTWFDLIKRPFNTVGKGTQESRSIPTHKDTFSEGEEFVSSFYLVNKDRSTDPAKTAEQFVESAKDDKGNATVGAPNFVSSELLGTAKPDGGIYEGVCYTFKSPAGVQLTDPGWFDSSGNYVGLHNTGNPLHWPAGVPRTGLNIPAEFKGKYTEPKVINGATVKYKIWEYYWNSIKIPFEAIEIPASLTLPDGRIIPNPEADWNPTTKEYNTTYRFEIKVKYGIRSANLLTSNIPDKTKEEQIIEIEEAIKDLKIKDRIKISIEKRETYNYYSNLPAGAFPSPYYTILSPNLTKISYVIITGQYPSYTYQIHVMNRDGSNKKLINTIIGYNLFLFWSPDGNKIAYQVEDTNYSTYYITILNEQITTQEYKIIKNISGNEFNVSYSDPTWSPDSKKIAYSYINVVYEYSEVELTEDYKRLYTKKITQRAYIEIIEVTEGRYPSPILVSTSGGKDIFIIEINGEIGHKFELPASFWNYYSWRGKEETINFRISWGQDNNLYYVLNFQNIEGDGWSEYSQSFFLFTMTSGSTGRRVSKEACIKEEKGRVIANYPSGYNIPAYSYSRSEYCSPEVPPRCFIKVEGGLPSYTEISDSISFSDVSKTGKSAYVLFHTETEYERGGFLKRYNLYNLYIEDRNIMTISRRVENWHLKWSPVEDILGYATTSPDEFYLYDADKGTNILVGNVSGSISWNKDGDRVSVGRYEITNPKEIVSANKKGKAVDLGYYVSNYSTKEKEEIFSYPLNVISKRITAGISEPKEYEIVSSSNYEIKGTVKALRGIANWKLEYAYEDDASKNDEQLDWANHVIGSGNTEIFDGVLGSLDTSGLKDATYRLRLNVTDKTTPTAVTESTTTKVRVRNKVGVAEVTGQPSAEAIIPSSEPIPVTFTLNQDCWVNVKVKDSSDNVVATIADNYVYPAGSNTVYWWGVADDGTWVSEGNYKFEITPTDVTRSVGTSVVSIPLPSIYSFLVKAISSAIIGEVSDKTPQNPDESMILKKIKKMLPNFEDESSKYGEGNMYVKYKMSKPKIISAERYGSYIIIKWEPIEHPNLLGYWVNISYDNPNIKLYINKKNFAINLSKLQDCLYNE